MIVDGQEVSRCGMTIHYSVDTTTDFIVYNDINGRGEGRKSEKCSICSWRGICKPTEVDYMEIIRKQVGRDIKPSEVIRQIVEKMEKDGV